MVLIGKPLALEEKKKKGWRDRMAESNKKESVSWKVA
jgi:hypothetical protein